jgi:hypothetical protein
VEKFFTGYLFFRCIVKKKHNFDSIGDFQEKIPELAPEAQNSEAFQVDKRIFSAVHLCWI